MRRILDWYDTRRDVPITWEMMRVEITHFCQQNIVAIGEGTRKRAREGEGQQHHHQQQEQQQQHHVAMAAMMRQAAAEGAAAVLLAQAAQAYPIQGQWGQFGPPRRGPAPGSNLAPCRYWNSHNPYSCGYGDACIFQHGDNDQRPGAKEARAVAGRK